MKPPVRVLGVGSPHGVDRLGWEVVARLRDHPRITGAGARVAVHAVDRPGTGLIDALRADGRLILVDALQAGYAPGTVVRLSGAALAQVPPRVSTHGLGVADAWALAQALGECAAEVTFLGVDVGEGTGEPPPEQYVTDLVEAVLMALDSIDTQTAREQGALQSGL